jgi:hypothetical protein
MPLAKALSCKEYDSMCGKCKNHANMIGEVDKYLS